MTRALAVSLALLVAFGAGMVVRPGPVGAATLYRSYTFDQSNEGWVDTSSTAAGYVGGGLSVTTGYEIKRPGGVSFVATLGNQYRIKAVAKGASCQMSAAVWSQNDTYHQYFAPGNAPVENTGTIWKFYEQVFTVTSHTNVGYWIRIHLKNGCVYDSIKLEDVTGDGLANSYTNVEKPIGQGDGTGGSATGGGTASTPAPAPVAGAPPRTGGGGSEYTGGGGGTDTNGNGRPDDGGAVEKGIYNKTYSTDPDSDLSTVGGCAPNGPLSGDPGKPLMCLMAIDQCEKPLVALDVPGWLSYVWCELRNLPRHLLNGLLTLGNVVIDLLIPAPTFGTDLEAELSNGEAVDGSGMSFTAGASSVSNPGAITIFGQTGSVDIIGVFTGMIQPLRGLMGAIVYGMFAMFAWETFRRRVLRQDEDMSVQAE